MDRIWPLLLLVPVAPALLLACTSQTCDIPEDAWWEVCADTGEMDDTGEGDDTGDDDEEWDEGSFLYVALMLNEDTVSEAEVAFVAATEDGVQCEAWHEIQSATPGGGCVDCEATWTLVVGESETEGDGCEGWPLPSGSELKVGWSGSQAYRLQDGAWVGGGEAEIWDEGEMELVFTME